MVGEDVLSDRADARSVDARTAPPVGFAIVALAAWTWTVGTLLAGGGPVPLASNLLMAAGFSVLAWAWRTDPPDVRATAVGLAGALAGALVFIVQFDVLAGPGPFTVPNLLFLAALVGLVFLRRTTPGHDPVSAVGYAVASGLAALAALGWVVLGAAQGTWVWVPTNALAAAGFATVAWGSLRERGSVRRAGQPA